MVDFHDPAVVQADFVAFVKLIHVTAGLYMWEYLTTLNFEWSYITGERPYRRTIWVYAIGRLASLATAVIFLVSLNVRAKVNCQAMYSISLICSYLAFTCTATLVALRVIAIWLWSRYTIALSVGLWSVTAGFFLFGIIQGRSSWVPGLGCSTAQGDWLLSARGSVNSIFATDFVLLLLQLIGLLRFGRTRERGVWVLLCKQGIIWLAVATFAQLVAMLFMNMNFNSAYPFYEKMFVTPAMYAMQICVSRMYCSLMEHNERPGAILGADPNELSLSIPTIEVFDASTSNFGTGAVRGTERR
ncbi:hypothetical protein BC834DRAFT_524914 [Gloeopeniophorella convolvens]|nr:hypothetical protein BC834DRAFT_524914 [Gloeopeniophorella convolvens]